MSSHVHRKWRRTGRIHIGLILLLCLAVALGVLGGAYAALVPHHDRIAHGVVAYGVTLGGLSHSAAKQALATTLDAVGDQQVMLQAGDHKRTVRLHELGMRIDLEGTLRAAFAVGRSGSWVTRAVNAARARWVGLNLTPDVRFDDRRAKDVLAAFGAGINQTPVEASAHWDGQRVVLTPGKSGAKLDVPASVKLVKASVLASVPARKPMPATMQLPYREKAPRITTAMLAPVDTVLGTYATSYGSSSRNRITNIVTAAKAIDQVILRPGEVFSFNNTVGPRTLKRGYREAPVIIRGMMDNGIGGGICQVSTTLYNAVLLANLDITMRNHHSLPSHYVPLGLDATVSYGALDFRFRNSTDAPIIIESVPSRGRLLVRVLGQGPAPQVKILRTGIVSIPGRTVTKKDPTLPKGMRVVENKGTGGKKVTITRVVGPDYANATPEIISRDRYPGEPTVIRIGTGPAKATRTENAPAPPEDAPPTAQ